MKMTMQLRPADRAGQLAQRLAHQPRLQADMAVAHLTLDLGPRHQSRNRIDDQHVDGVRAHQRVDDLQRLLARVGLGDDQFVDVDTQFLGVAGIERMFGVDEGGRAAGLLRLGDDMQRECRLARTFRSVDFDHPAARQSADAKRDVEPEAAGGNRVDLDLLAAAQLHRRALAECPVDLRERCLERFLPVHIACFSAERNDFQLRCHDPCLLVKSEP